MSVSQKTKKADNGLHEFLDEPRGFVDGNFASGKVLDLHVSGCYTIAFHPLEKLLAVGLLRGRGVALYETRTFTLVHTLDRDDSVSTLSWLPLPPEKHHEHTTSLLAVGGLDGTVSLYKMRVDLLELEGANLVHQFRLAAEIRSMDLFVFDPYIVVAVGTKNGKVYCTTFTKDFARHNTAETDDLGTAVLGMAVGSTRALLATCTKGGDVAVRSLRHHHHQSEQLLLSLGVDLWYAKRNGPVYDVEFSNDEGLLLFGGYDKNVVLVDTNVWAVVRELKLNGSVSSLRYDPKCRYLGVGCRDKTFTLYDTSTYFPIKTLETPGWVTCVSWGNVHGDSDNLAIRVDQQCVSVLDIAPIEKIGRQLFPPHSGAQVYALSWSYDGRFLARVKGRCIHFADAHDQFADVATVLLDEPLKSVAFCHAEGKRDLLAAVGLDGMLTVIQFHVEEYRFLPEVIASKFVEDGLWTVAWSGGEFHQSMFLQIHFTARITYSYFV